MKYYLGLGSNIGEQEENLKMAIEHISKINGVSIVRASSFYKTKPWGYKEQNDFLNMAILVKSECPPQEFLLLLKDIEAKMGKKIICKWGPRTIDIDILFCDDLVLDDENLKIPHPLLSQRDFVLLPMLEIAKQHVHPVSKETIEEIYLKSRVGVIILAAGKGTRMNSDKPKVCFELAGQSLIQRVVNTSLEMDADLIGIVVGYKKELVMTSLAANDKIKFVTQEDQLGTGHAVRCSKELFNDFLGTVFVLCGDVPLLRAKTMSDMLKKHSEKNAKCTVLTMFLTDPDRYGRIVRDNVGKVKEIIEFKDASDEIRKINEINTGIYCFDSMALFEALEKVENSNAQKEYYLTDVLKIMYDESKTIESVVLEDVYQATGVNSQDQLAELEKVYYMYCQTNKINATDGNKG